MKKIAAVSCLLLISLALISFSVARYRFNELLMKTLDISASEAASDIDNSFVTNYLVHPENSTIKKIPVAKRAAIVKQLGDYIKAHVKTPAFAKLYEERRRPYAPASWEVLVEDEFRMNRRKVDDEIEDLQKSLSSAPANMKAMYERQLKEAKHRKTALTDPKTEEYKEGLEAAEASYRQRNNKEAFMTAYNEQKQKFDKRFPAKLDDMLRDRLQGFLDLTADINFDAELVKGGLGMKFADPELERKSDAWKKCFRAGRETITAARAYAQGWLKTLPPASK